MYVFTLMENFEKSTMQKVCTDLAKTLPAVIYSAILRLQMPERNFVWNLQHIRVTTLVLSIRFTVEIKCRSGVIFSIITSLEPDRIIYLFASIVTILFSIALGIVYKTKFNMEYLGWCMLMGSVWMIGESKMRQILVPNASGLATSCFIMLMLCPLPISLYVNNLQKGKYKKIFQPICFIALLNFIICTILHLTGVADYIETMPAAHAILIITFLAVILTFWIRYWNHRSRSDCLLFFGLLITMLSVIFEAISVYYKVSVSGVFVGIAILILLFINVIYTIHIIRDIIKRQQQEELDKRKKNIEEMSLQLMQMLSTTIEAKDEYTKGHSHRVAEYSVLIARELGWNEKELSNLKNAAHLHDIGKIAIPDTILNKPSKLSEEEFSIIKEHTIIGANILKNNFSDRSRTRNCTQSS